MLTHIYVVCGITENVYLLCDHSSLKTYKYHYWNKIVMICGMIFMICGMILLRKKLFLSYTSLGLLLRMLDICFVSKWWRFGILFLMWYIYCCGKINSPCIMTSCFETVTFHAFKLIYWHSWCIYLLYPALKKWGVYWFTSVFGSVCPLVRPSVIP